MKLWEHLIRLIKIAKYSADPNYGQFQIRYLNVRYSNGGPVFNWTEVCDPNTGLAWNRIVTACSSNMACLKVAWFNLLF